MKDEVGAGSGRPGAVEVPPAGAVVTLPAGCVEAVAVRPGDQLVVRVKPGMTDLFAEEWAAHRPEGLTAVVVECEQLGVIRRLD